MPKLSLIAAWLDAHGAYLLALLPALVVVWKALPAATRARLEAASPRLTGLVRFVAAVGPDVLGAARIARHQVVAGQPRASVTPTVANNTSPAPVNIVVNGAITEQQGADLARALREASTRGNARAGFAAVDALAIALGVGALAFTAVALSGCPTWVRPACGAPGAYSCVSDRPHVCSPSGALTPVGDLPCSRSRGQCAMSDAGVAHCAPLASDGGAQ